ncbi:nuclear transport factor 2 family protein [Sandarakinorhabdus sp. AAP62]|uniref:YybH family protein n=1 Tax=Sandarakinorhabdus sp. AAP62 TaxID=1248916 RepID=UPI00187BCE2C|nr:nuclear transport factor 2 family protein [Sandarakinorhabdus sp. AAP62]
MIERVCNRWGAASPLLAIMLLAGCNAGAGKAPQAEARITVDRQAVAAEVKAAIGTQIEAYAARDPVKAASIAAPDMLGMMHGAPNNVGRDAVLAQIKAQMADPALKLEASDETVDVAEAGDMAIYQAIYRFTFTNPATGQPSVETGNWVAVFKRQADGTMKLSKDMVLDLPAASAASGH